MQSLSSNSSADLAQKDDAPILAKSQKHMQSNLHRLAFSTTSFPYRDPSAPVDSARLLGIRIDICNRDGQFVKPYYLLLKKDASDAKLLQVYRHTIPPFIPLKALERRYLPSSIEDEDSDDPKANSRKQDLPRLVRKVRQHLVSWHLRQEAIELLRDDLDLRSMNKAMGANGEGSSSSDSGESDKDNGRLGIASLAATAVEARFARVEWTDGRVGQIKISDSGQVDRAVIYGEDGREQDVERVLMGGSGRIEDMVQRLEAVERMKT